MPKPVYVPVCVANPCGLPAVDEYHWFQEITSHGVKVEVEVVWNLCEDHCDFAVEVVEFISRVDDPRERETWTEGLQ